MLSRPSQTLPPQQRWDPMAKDSVRHHRLESSASSRQAKPKRLYRRLIIQEKKKMLKFFCFPQNAVVFCPLLPFPMGYRNVINLAPSWLLCNVFVERRLPPLIKPPLVTWRKLFGIRKTRTPRRASRHPKNRETREAR